MCRLVAYTGDNLLLADVIVKPEDSLIKQSLRARESTTLTNGDGFGVGWYIPEIDLFPAVFLSTLPAWNDENLLHLANKTTSSLFFSHVRAASSGGVNNYNCHPFIYKNWMFMHNGQIDNFLAIKRAITALLDDDLYNWIRGGTDSEHFFALFLQFAKGHDFTEWTNVTAVLQQTFDTIDNLLQQVNVTGTSYYNLCITDGRRIIATRYCTNAQIEPESLHYMEGRYFWSQSNYLAEVNSKPHRCVLIASEMLTDFNQQWQTVPANHFILVDEHYSVNLLPIAGY